MAPGARGVLRAQPPAVEGLAPIAFSASGSSFASEEDWDKVEQTSRWADLVRILVKLAQRELEQEESEELIPDWMVREADRLVGCAQEKVIQSEEGMVKQFSQEELDQTVERVKAEAKAEGKLTEPHGGQPSSLSSQVTARRPIQIRPVRSTLRHHEQAMVTSGCEAFSSSD